MKPIRIKKVKAFTLNEMLVVLAIIAILMLGAWPIFKPLISKAKSQEAQSQLKYISNLQTQYQYLNSKYSMEFNAIDFQAPVTINNGGTANYAYEIIQASNGSFKARAEAVVDFDGDGAFNVWEIDESGVLKEITKD